jgi:hypothetical protein
MYIPSLASGPCLSLVTQAHHRAHRRTAQHTTRAVPLHRWVAAPFHRFQSDSMSPAFPPNNSPSPQPIVMGSKPLKYDKYTDLVDCNGRSHHLTCIMELTKVAEPAANVPLTATGSFAWPLDKKQCSPKSTSNRSNLTDSQSSIPYAVANRAAFERPANLRDTPATTDKGDMRDLLQGVGSWVDAWEGSPCSKLLGRPTRILSDGLTLSTMDAGNVTSSSLQTIKARVERDSGPGQCC